VKVWSAGALNFDARSHSDTADMALITAHNLILNVLDLQKEHFKLATLDKPLEKCFQDFRDISKPDSDDQKARP